VTKAVWKLPALYEAGLIAEPSKRAQALAKIVLDKNSGIAIQLGALDLLEAPAAATAEQKEASHAALLTILKADEAIHDDFGASYAADALARAGQTTAFDAIAERSARKQDLAHPNHEYLAPMAELVTLDPALTPKFVQAARRHLPFIHCGPSEVAWAIWRADARELLPDLARVATSLPAIPEPAPDAPETANRGYHAPRKVAALWSEPDPATRFRLLFAAAWNEPREFEREAGKGNRARLASEMQKSAAEVTSAAERQQLRAFIDRLRAEALAGQGEPRSIGAKLPIANLAVAALSEPR
jgi:hypothetical protein